MFISALCDYYDVLAKQGKVLPAGYSKVGIHSLIALTEDGKIESIIDCQETITEIVKGKVKEKKISKEVVLPKRTEKPGIDGNIIEHRPLYIFGLNYDAKTATLSAEDKTDKARKSHAAFANKNLEFLAGIDTPLVNAYRSFIKSWEPENETQNEILLGAGKLLTTGRFAFCLAGHPELLLHNEPQIKQKWEQIYAAEAEGFDVPSGQCCITGNVEPIESIHTKIKGLPGGSAMGNTMVSFNSPAEESYGKKQSNNSCISGTAMRKYTEALNYLLADKRHRTLIDETTYVYWAASGEESCEDIFNALAFGDTMDSEQTDNWLKTVFDGIRSGKATQDIVSGIENIDSDVSFYVVGIKPNSARLALKCIYRQSFGKILQNTVQHYSDMQIGNSTKPVTIRAICRELISPKSTNDKVSPALMAKLFDAIINGTPYPESLLATVVRRVKTDSDEENNKYIQMNNIRMGLIKACINRSARFNGKKEEIKMSLDTENKNPAYLCGRLFCKLEEIQTKALGEGINRTIKDAYFASASTRPAVVFPRLIALSQHHLAKLEDKRAFYLNRDVTEIMGMLGSEFPSNLSLKDQGVFMLGYYQQRNKRFENKAAATAAEE